MGLIYTKPTVVPETLHYMKARRRIEKIKGLNQFL